MTTPSIVITGASRGLGLASAQHFYGKGWRVVAAMRSVEDGLDRLRTATGASRSDDRLVGVRLDLLDPASITEAARQVQDNVGAPDVLVHNAGIAGTGMVEETPADLWHTMFATNVFGPVALTRALLPTMRQAGRGRIVLVSSVSGLRGMPATAAYSAAKAATERWGESLAVEIAPFGLGVTVLVTGTFATDIIADGGSPDHRDFDGVYARHHAGMDLRGHAAIRGAKPASEFAEQLARHIDKDSGPYARHAVGRDAAGLVIASRMLSGKSLHRIIRRALAIPPSNSLRTPLVPRAER
jgi:NAD(P)-dependent dehydrogenase (short-subunit alcohol dehydrogenase family)